MGQPQVWLVVVGMVLAGAWLLRRVQLQLARSAPRPPAMRPGVPVVIYFWSRSCGICRAGQMPVLQALRRRHGPDGVQVIAYEVGEHRALARRYGVVVAPTLVLLDGAGRLLGVANGMTSLAQLERALGVCDEPFYARLV